MNIRFAIIFSLLVCIGSASAQQVLYGTNKYIEYQFGTFPLIISVPHGGNLEPASIPDRTCNNPTTVTDINTIETALEIRNSMFEKTGCYPHLVICHLRRKKIDCNRTIADGACGNPETEKAWNEFHHFIDTALKMASRQFGNAFLVDIHGHAHTLPRIELGYMLSGNELEFPDSVLNASKYINESSIRILALKNSGKSTHAQLLRGEKSLGTLLTDQGFPAVPGKTIPFPGAGNDYFSGGYITANHTSYKFEIETNGIQMELNYNGIRNSEFNRKSFGNAFSKAMIEFINTHMSVSLNNCRLLSTVDFFPSGNISIFPYPVIMGESIVFSTSLNRSFKYLILNISGQTMISGILGSDINQISTDKFNSGIYVLQLYDMETGVKQISKFFLK
jgi:N-formylglutamate amidohydrolase